MKRSENTTERYFRFTDILGLFAAITFSTFLAAMIIVFGITVVMVRTGTFHITENALPDAERLILLIALLSFIVNLVFIIIAGQICLKPLDKFINGINRLAQGDYSPRIEIGKPFGRLPMVKTLSDSFNRLASELGSTEMLRSDFINNFSHEFKTPIVSIAGFARLLKKGGLSRNTAMEYVDIIEEEARRLAYMSTNVLNLTKIENQSILTDITVFNLSEQIRSCILLLEDKWTRKDIDLRINFKEHMIAANEELLKHVWINLIDNAIKFSPEHGAITFDIGQDASRLFVSITNSGSAIPPEAQKKIFNKFYQADESHSSGGNGIGLAIVKNVTELHNGSVKMKSDDGITTFTVTLPKNHDIKR